MVIDHGTVFVEVMSLEEIAISKFKAANLFEAGRLPMSTRFEAWLARSFRTMPVNEALVTHEIAVATRAVSVARGDPADRLLAATARVLDLTLVTADERLIEGRGYKVLANR